MILFYKNDDEMLFYRRKNKSPFMKGENLEGKSSDLFSQFSGFTNKYVSPCVTIAEIVMLFLRK
ncbi:MAG: hypothetical protein EHM20_06910 [Alphaproteobacteria bacterium]|nr:MAG: hypothetical protein EHM20_06910 [Alphaproteobacteria bacterium]